jgi:hypothetical protein
MQPHHSIEYELSTEMATDIHRALLRWEIQRGWRRDIPTYLGALVFAGLIAWLGLAGWIVPGFAMGLLCVLVLFVMGTVWRRWSLSHAATGMALLALHSPDRRIRVEFDDQRVRLESEFFRGEGAWTELDEIVIFPAFWVLRFSNDGRVLIPASLAVGELEAFVRAQAQQVTAPIRQA